MTENNSVELQKNISLDRLKVKDVVRTSPFEKLVYVASDTSLSDIFFALAHADILCVPVLENPRQGEEESQSERHCLGLVDVLDCVKMVQKMYLEKKGHELGSNESGDYDVEMMRNLIEGTTARNAINMSERNPFIPVTVDTPLTEVLEHFANGIHRVVVVDPTEEEKEKNELSKSKIQYFLTQTDIVHWLYTNMDDNPTLSSLTQRTLTDLDLGVRIIDNMTIVFCIEYDSRALEAFRLMHKAKVSGLGILGDDTRLVGSISASDLRGVTPDNLEMLTYSVAEFIRWSRTRPVSTHRSPVDQVQTQIGDQHQRVVSCTRNDPLRVVIEKMKERRVHRVFTVAGENNREPEGVVSMTDVCRLLCIAAK